MKIDRRLIKKITHDLDCSNEFIEEYMILEEHRLSKHGGDRNWIRAARKQLSKNHKIVQELTLIIENLK